MVGKIGKFYAYVKFYVFSFDRHSEQSLAYDVDNSRSVAGLLSLSKNCSYNKRIGSTSSGGTSSLLIMDRLLTQIFQIHKNSMIKSLRDLFTAC